LDVKAIPVIESPAFLSVGSHYGLYLLLGVIFLIIVLFVFYKRIKIIFSLCILFIKNKSGNYSQKDLIAQIDDVVPSCFYNNISVSDTDQIALIKYSNKELSEIIFIQRLIIKMLVLCFSGTKG